MSTALKKILEKLFEIMKQEGIRSIYISRNSHWDDQEHRQIEDDEYTTDIHMISNKR